MDWRFAVICPLEASGIVFVQNGCSFCCQLVRFDQVPTTLKVCFGRSCADADAPPRPMAAASASDATTRLSILVPPFACRCCFSTKALIQSSADRQCKHGSSWLPGRYVQGDAARCERTDLSGFSCRRQHSEPPKGCQQGSGANICCQLTSATLPPLPVLHGESVRVRGSHMRQSWSLSPPLTPNPSPQGSGEMESHRGAISAATRPSAVAASCRPSPFGCGPRASRGAAWPP